MSSISKKVIVFGIIVFGLASIPSYYFYSQYKKAQLMLKNPAEAAKEEVRVVISKVGKLIDLPDKEFPTLATVSDKNKLKNQPFFANAENGDKVLIYTTSKKAVLYRPSNNRIVEVAPLTVRGEVAGASSSSAQLAKAKKTQIVIFNGTAIAGLAGKAEAKLEEKFSTIEVVEKQNAQKKDYTTNFILDLKGTNKDLVEKIAKVISADIITKLPDGEGKPEGDILIIVGK